MKGSYFVIARRYLLERHGEDTLEAVIAELPARDRHLLEEPSGSAWYPEPLLMACQHALDEVITLGDMGRFEQEMAGCIQLGVNTFFKALLSLSTPEFMLRNYPTLFKRVRRGPARAEVEASGRRFWFHFVDLPNADHPFTLASARATFDVLVKLTGHPPPRVELQVRGGTRLSVGVDLEEQQSRVQRTARALPEAGEG